MPPVLYPRLIRRVRAFLLDSVILPITVFGALIGGDALGVSHAYGKVALVLGPVFFLEPGLVAITGGTIGHHLFKIRVTKLDGHGNINVFAATVRFVVKLLLGWLSFIFVLTTRKHQAVHDLVARSVVIHKDASSLPTHEALPERAPDSAEYVYPARWRRVLIIAGYWFLATVALSFLSNIVASSACIEGHRCATGEYLLLLVLNIAWLVSLGWITVKGWGGLLHGCRRHPRGVA